jgi:hypothetical protein
MVDVEVVGVVLVCKKLVGVVAVVVAVAAAA